MTEINYHSCLRKVFGVKKVIMKERHRDIKYGEQPPLFQTNSFKGALCLDARAQSYKRYLNLDLAVAKGASRSNAHT